MHFNTQCNALISNPTNVLITDHFVSDLINFLNISKLNRDWSKSEADGFGFWNPHTSSSGFIFLFIRSNGSSWLPPANLPSMHTHIWPQQTNSLFYPCLRTWDCCCWNERINLSACPSLISTQMESTFKLGFYVSKFSPLGKRQGVKQKQDKSNPLAERYSVPSCYYLSSSQACVKASFRTG